MEFDLNKVNEKDILNLGFGFLVYVLIGGDKEYVIFIRVDVDGNVMLINNVLIDVLSFDYIGL